MNNLVIIHIGICGGSTVRSELRSKNIKFSEIHIREAIYKPKNKYVIVIRNPIKRFISAFNWRYYLVCSSKKQENRFKNEKNILYINRHYFCNKFKCS